MCVDERGNSVVPSAVHIPENGDAPIVGTVAINRAVRKPDRTSYDAKRGLTKKITDPEIVRYREFWPF